MSIKSRTPGIASDMPLHSRDRSPSYTMNEKKMKKPAHGQIDNMSGYVSENLKKAIKPRGGEHR